MKINLGNSNKVLRSGFTTDSLDFKPLKDFVGQTITINGWFTTLGKYGEQLVVLGDKILINMPGRAVAEFEAIKKNEDYMAKFQDGDMYIDNIRMEEFKNGTGVAYDVNIKD